MPDRKWICLVCSVSIVALLLPAVAGAAVPTPNVLWWQFDEGSGDVAIDNSGNGRDGVIIGAQWKSGGVGGLGSCLEFLGNGQMVEDDDAGDYLNGLGAITVAMWVKCRSVPTDKGFIIGENPAGNDSFVTMRYDVAGASFGGSAVLKMAVTSSPGGEQQLESSANRQVTEWHHVAMTWKGGDLIHFFSNGVEDTPTGRNGPNNAGTISGCTRLIVGKGGKDNSSTLGWDGLIDDVRIYDSVLTAAQIAELAANKPITFKASEPTPANDALGVNTPLLQWKKGDTAIFHDVYLGTTPDLTEADRVASRQPFAMYFHVPGLEPGATYYWRVDEIEADMTTVRTGNVWSFVAQARTAYYPTPVDQTTDASPAATLTWLPGMQVLKHHLYLSDDRDAVAQGAAGTDKGELAGATYSPTDLKAGTTYYWRVDESVVGGEVRTGDVWSFTTFIPVDDFEAYTDDEGGRIYETWIDGWTNNTGSLVGNLEAPFAEQTVVSAGLQSMPMDYNNVNAPFYSETEREFSPVQDWTAGGVTDLRLAFRGLRSNGAGSLYVAVADSSGKSAVVVHSDPDAVKATTWTQWPIPLSSFAGVNLARVKTLYIGVGDRDNPVAGGAGRIYIDEIRLTKPGASVQ